MIKDRQKQKHFGSSIWKLLFPVNNLHLFIKADQAGLLLGIILVATHFCYCIPETNNAEGFCFSLAFFPPRWANLEPQSS
jgi:hypothetical protein